ncbi:MAG: hypothetical protein ACUVX8_07855 [Candidatus Zipacnadales bacterium]
MKGARSCIRYEPNPEHFPIAKDAHFGKTALELSARDGTSEVQYTSRLMAITGGKVYQLTPCVKPTAGQGKYKVTINGLGKGGHFAYANEWQGINRPAEYTNTAVASSHLLRLAQLSLSSVRSKTMCCIFDDISFRSAE